MLKKSKMLVLIAVLLFTSSIGYADGFNYRIIRLNPTNTIQRNYWDLIISDYNTRTKPGVVVELPTKPSTPVVPTTPVETTKPVVPTTPVVPTPPVEQPTQSYAGLSAEESEVVRLVNIEREKNGLAPLKASSQLSNVARMKSQDMATKNYFSHTSPTYGSPFDMMKQFGISYKTAGENIAKGYLSPASVMNGWMNSSGHRANILNSSFGTIGVGAYKVGSTIYWTQMFTN